MSTMDFDFDRCPICDRPLRRAYYGLEIFDCELPNDHYFETGGYWALYSWYVGNARYVIDLGAVVQLVRYRDGHGAGQVCLQTPTEFTELFKFDPKDRGAVARKINVLMAMQ